MTSCHVCYDGTLNFTRKEVEMMPPPTGTKWAPLPIEVFYYKCNTCGSIYRQRHNESLVLVEEQPYLENLVWSCIESSSPEAIRKLARFSGAAIPPLLRTLVHIYKEYGKERRNLLGSGGTMVEREIERINQRVLDPCKELLAALDESAQLRLCASLDDPALQKVSALLLHLMDSASSNVLHEVRRRTSTGAIRDASTLQLLKSFLFYWAESHQDRAWFASEAQAQALEPGDLHTRAVQGALLELLGWSSLSQPEKPGSASAPIWRRLLLIALAAALTTALALVIADRYRLWRAEQKAREEYDAAVALLEAGEMEAARARASSISRSASVYGDAQAIIVESYYRSGATALGAQEWAAARLDLAKVGALSAGYKDADTLLREAYYRPAAAALEAGQWDVARDSLQSLLDIDGTYGDAAVLLRESFYRPAVQAMQAGEWETAQTALRRLLELDNSYRDTKELLREAYYGAARALIESEEWGAAARAITQLNGLAYDYRGVSELVVARPEMRQALLDEYYYLWKEWSVAFTETLDCDDCDSWGLALSANGRLLALSRGNGVVKVWNFALPESEPVTLGAVPGGVFKLGFSFDGKTLAATSIDGNVRLWDLDSATELSAFVSGWDPSFTPDLRRCVAGGADATVTLWDVATGRQVAASDPFPDDQRYGDVTGTALSPDGKTAAWHSDQGEGSGFIWDSVGDIAVTLEGIDSVWAKLAFTPDGATLILAYKYWIQAWDVASGSKLWDFGEIFSMVDMAMYPGGRLLATSSEHSGLQMWDLASPQQLPGPEFISDLRGVTFSPDGSTLAVASASGVVWLWRAGPRAEESTK